MIPKEITDSLINFLADQHSMVPQIHSADSLSGGCINQVFRIKTDAGDFCLKFNRKEAFPGMFESEARGLCLLKDANEIRVPRVIHTGSGDQFSYLLLEFVNPGSPVPGFMADFGHSLARLHRHSASLFGGGEDNYMGSLPQSNRNHADWVSFFIEERLEKQVHLAESSGYLTKEACGCFHRLYKRVEQIFPQEAPSLLHGDLWGGNFLVAENGLACLIDPAVYYGHREIDIAMTTLFGGFDNTFYTAYHEEFPLEKGWQGRLDICNLYPLLIHLNLFGSGYLGQIESIVRRY